MLAKLDNMNLTDKFNMILTSAAFNFNQNKIILSDYVDPSFINWTTTRLSRSKSDKGLLSTITAVMGHVCY
jgi:hypothetical protein